MRLTQVRILFPMCLLGGLILAACGGADGSATSTPGIGGGSVGDSWYVETSGDDSNSCRTVAAACATIQGALSKAEPSDEIRVGAGTFFADSGGTIYGTQLELDISIIGEGPGSTIVDGEATRNVFTVYEGDVSIRNMTIQNGGGSLGHGVFSPRPAPRASLHLENVLIQDNAGWGVEAESDFVIEDSTVTQNAGGGIAAGGIIRRTDIMDNGGRGIFTSGGELSVIDSSVSGHSFSNGPGLFTFSGLITIEGSTFFDNVNTNTSGGGTVQLQGGSLTMVNSTISGNTGTGVSLTVPGAIDIIFSTIVGNSLSGISTVDVTGRFQNNLLSNGGSRDCVFLVSGVGAGFSRSDNVYSRGLDSECRGSVVEDVLVDVLADNGGPTMTHALLEGSPAIEAAGDCIGDDQTDAARPIGPACDVGAYEAGAFAMSGELPDEEPFVTISTQTPCYSGPGPNYAYIVTMEEGQQARALGYGFGGGWFVIEPPQNAGRNCWVDEDKLQFDFDLSLLRLIAIPPKPSPTPSRTPEVHETVAPTPTCDPQFPPCP